MTEQHRGARRDGLATRRRILEEAMRLFGEKGYEATTIAEIEANVGISPGSGGLYRHFRTKRELLAAGVLAQVRSVQGLLEFIDNPAQLAQLTRRQRLAVLAKAGLRRLDAKRDLNRLLHRRDLTDAPELLDALRRDDLQLVFRGVTRWLEAEASETEPSRDWQAVAAVLVGAVAHYWLIRDAMGGHPDDVDEARFVAAWADMATALLGADEPDR